MSGETYMFMSQPRAVDAARKKYREVEEEIGGFDNTANIMFDPRVIRGITCTGPDVNKTMVMEQKENEQDYELKKQTLLAAGKIRPKLDTVATIHDNILVPKTRVEVPLHLYLLEQVEEVPTAVGETQTDVFLEEDPEPKFIPLKTGVDMETQVENQIVFDYDIDVMPILEVVISKTVEQSLMEVRQEEELRTVSRKREHLQQKARVRAEEAAKLEKEERAALRAKEQMLLESRQRHAREVSVQKKLASNVFAAKYLANLQEAVFDELSDDNYFFNPTRLNVEHFAPWLKAKIADNLKGVREGENWTNMLIARTLTEIKQQQQRIRDHKKQAQLEAEAAAVEAEKKAKEAVLRARKMQLYIHTDVVPEPVGPIELSGNSTVAEIKIKILEWLSDNMDDPPSERAISFVYNSEPLLPTSVLFDLGMETLSTIQMVVEQPPVSNTPEKVEK